jgi:hypothetical protein
MIRLAVRGTGRGGIGFFWKENDDAKLHFGSMSLFESD